jgi:hypothetical protein
MLAIPYVQKHYAYHKGRNTSLILNDVSCSRHHRAAIHSPSISNPARSVAEHALKILSSIIQQQLTHPPKSPVTSPAWVSKRVTKGKLHTIKRGRPEKQVRRAQVAATTGRDLGVFGVTLGQVSKSASTI